MCCFASFNANELHTVTIFLCINVATLVNIMRGTLTPWHTPSYYSFISILGAICGSPILFSIAILPYGFMYIQ